MCDNHLELGMQESHAATHVSTWQTWCEAVEAALGHDLDGTQWIDGYSLDYARQHYHDDCQAYGEGNASVTDYVEMVRNNKARIEAGDFVTRISEKSMRDCNDDGDETRWDEVTLYVGKATDEQVAQYVEEYFPSEHCQHEYDCCGRWYANRAGYKRHGALVIVKQSYSQNI